MNESGYGPRARRRAGIAIAALLGVVLALLPMGPALAATPNTGLTVTSPTFDEDFTRGQVVTITWATNYVAGTTLTIDLMQSNGTTLVSNLSSTVPVKPNAYKWTVPMAAASLATGSYKIKITTNTAGPKSDVSDDPFNVTDGVIAPTSPKVTDNWKLGDTGRLVKWDPGTATGPMVVDLLDGSNALVNNVKASVPATAKSFSWDIPVGIATATGTYKLRFNSIANPAVTGVSASFTLTLPTIAVTFPTAAFNWDVGSAQTIKWTSQAPGTVKIELTNAAGVPIGSPLKTGVPAKSGSFVFNMPANTTVASGANKILVTSEQNAQVSALSGAFNTTTPVVTVNNPSGSTLSMGDNVKIKWTTSVAGKVKIELLDGSDALVKTLTPVAGVATTSPTAASTFNWDIPLSVATSGGTYKIKVTTLTTPAFSNSSSFTLNVPTVSLAGTTLGTWGAGTLHTIAWTTSPATITTSVKLDLYASGPVLFRTIKTVPVRPGSLAYVVPYDVPFGTYFLRITSVGPTGNANITADSATFTVGAPSITVNAPSNFSVSSSAAVTVVPLTFTTAMSGTVKLQLVSGTSVVGTIKGNLPSTATSFNWDMPIGMATATGIYKIRLASLQSTGSNFYLDSAGFTITLPTITVGVTGPWTASSTRTVTWSGFTAGSVKITLNNNATPSTILTLKPTVTASLATSSVSVPAGLASGTYTVTVTSLLNPSITGTATVSI